MPGNPSSPGCLEPPIGQRHVTSFPFPPLPSLSGKTGIPAILPPRHPATSPSRPRPSHAAAALGALRRGAGNSAAVRCSAREERRGERIAAAVFSVKVELTQCRRGCLRDPSLAVLPAIPTAAATRPAAASLALLEDCPSLLLGFLRGQRGRGGFPCIPPHELPSHISRMHTSCWVALLQTPH